jgi:Spy/CpxP family protein refolding chaperone
MADMMFFLKKNKEKEAEKQKERETKESLKTAFTPGASDEEKFFKKVNEREAERKEITRKTVKDNENVNMAKAAFG